MLSVIWRMFKAKIYHKILKLEFFVGIFCENKMTQIKPTLNFYWLLIIHWPDIPVKSAAVGLKASLMPMAGSTDLRLNLFCILNLWTHDRKLLVHHLPLYRSNLKKYAVSLRIKRSGGGCMILTWAGICPSWFFAGRFPRRPADERWVGPRGKTAASFSRLAGPPVSSWSGPGTAAPTQCNADLMLSWTDLQKKGGNKFRCETQDFSTDLCSRFYWFINQFSRSKTVLSVSDFACFTWSIAKKPKIWK